MEVVGVAKEKITSISDELGREISMNEIGEALNQGFMNTLKLKLVEGQLNSDELELAKNLRVRKYACTNWNLSAESTY
jgi:lipoate-protein ligase A